MSKKITASAAVFLAIIIAAVLARPTEQARGFAGTIGGGPLNAGGGLSRVHITGPLLTGSGTSTNALGAVVTAGSGLGSGGGETLYVAAGSGITADSSSTRANNGSGLTWCSGATCVGAGSGIAVDATSVRTNSGSGLTYSSGALITNSGSGLTYSSGALITNAGSGLTYNSGALITNAGSGLTYSSGALITNVGTGLGYSAGAVVVSIAGGTCSNGQVVTAISSSGAATCGNAIPNDYGGTHLEWNDEFIYGTTSLGQTATGFGFWLSQNGGTTGTLGQSPTVYNTRPGIWEMATGTNAAGRSAFAAFGSTSTTMNLDASQETITIGVTVGFPVLSTSSEEITWYGGTGDVLSSANQTDGCGFLYDRGNVVTSGDNSGHASVWECYCANNGSRTVFRMDGSRVSDASFTTVNAPIAALTTPSSSNMDALQLIQTSTEADFYYHGTLSCKITTNLPGASTRVMGVIFEMLKTTGAGATSTLAEVDRVRIALDLNSAR